MSALPAGKDNHRCVEHLVGPRGGAGVELGSHSSGTFFVQQFLAKWGMSSHVNLLVMHLLRHLHDLVNHPLGHYVVQALLKCKTDFHHLVLVSRWMVNNISVVFKDKPVVQVARGCILYLLAEKTGQGSVTQWNKLLDEMVGKLTR